MSDLVKELREVTSPRWRELALRAAAELEVQALKLRSVEEELVAANQRCHDLIRGGEKILTERDSYALRLDSIRQLWNGHQGIERLLSGAGRHAYDAMMLVRGLLDSDRRVPEDEDQDPPDDDPSECQCGRGGSYCAEHNPPAAVEMQLPEGSPEARLKAATDAWADSGAFSNHECYFGARLGKCPESNECWECRLHAALFPPEERAPEKQ